MITPATTITTELEAGEPLPTLRLSLCEVFE